MSLLKYIILVALATAGIFAVSMLFSSEPLLTALLWSTVFLLVAFMVTELKLSEYP